jgi:D-glycero-alpha-D-manno-heptose 1-phosphate guanylyltransferase
MKTPRQRQTCIVLAGGLGTRLRSAVAGLPKCLAPVDGRPFIEIQVAALLRAGVDEVVLSLGFMADKVIEAVGRMDGRQRVRHVVEAELQGTGGAIAFAMDRLGLEEALVTNGDSYLDGDIGGMLAPLDAGAGELFRMAVVRVPDRGRFGGVQIDRQGHLLGFVEKGQQGPGEINAGLYRLRRDALPTGHSGAFSLEAEVLPGLVRRGAVRALSVTGNFTDIGVPDDYFRFCARHGG